MIKINKKVIILLTISLALIYVLLFYVNLANQDKYFPYWDAYNLKNQAESLNDDSFSNFSDPLVFYNIKILKEISGISYYSLIKYSSLFFIVFLFLAIILFMKDIFIKKEKNHKILPLFGAVYFFFFFYTYLRFSITLRENLVIGVALLFIFFLLKLETNNKNFIGGGIIFISLFLSYLLGAHMLVFMIFGGTTFFYLIYMYFKNNLFMKELFVILLFFIILTMPFIYEGFFGISYQFIHGEELITQAGFTVSYNFIKFNYFFPLFDLIIMLFGITFILKNHNKINPKKKTILLILLVIIGLGFFGSYLSFLGVKQNRFAIYIYLLLSIMAVFTFNYVKQRNLKFITILLIMSLIIILPINGILNYQTYKPINQHNIDYLSSQLANLSYYKTWYCGQSSEIIFKYLGKENNCLSINSIPDVNHTLINLDGPIILTSEDYFSLGDNLKNIENKNVLITDSKSFTKIILPENDIYNYFR